jgi:glutamine synthetase adenylyltransferase
VPLADELSAAGVADEAALACSCVASEQRHILRIIWRDLNRLAATMETTRDVSWLAEACIERALTACQAQLEAKFGVPTGRRSGERQELVVIAMGKLGARELNLSSDIDLIFAFPESGETLGARRSLSNEEFSRASGVRLSRPSIPRAPRVSCSASTCACGPTARAGPWPAASPPSRPTTRSRVATGSAMPWSRRDR